jgi:hypothetical protein
MILLGDSAHFTQLRYGGAADGQGAAVKERPPRLTQSASVAFS